MPQVKLQWCVWVAVLIVLTPSSIKGGNVHLMRRVLISLGRVTTGAPYTQVESFDFPEGASTALYCSSKCVCQDWCRLWCAHPSTAPTQCIISDIIVMPTFHEADMSDAIICHTTRPKDLATHATITGGNHNNTYPDYVKANLIDGFYSYYHRQRFMSAKDINEKWFVLDFGTPKTFQHVFLYAQEDSNAYRGFTEVVVRVGNMTVVDPPAGLAAYEMFGMFPGKAEPRQVVQMKYRNPVKARFVSVQKILDDQYEFMISHIEVF